MRHRGTPVELLLVEDSAADARLTSLAFQESGMPHRLHIAQDGEQALDYLRRASSPWPDLMLLDLNMPKMDGRQVLREVRADGNLRRLPIIVLSSSQAEEDVRTAYDLCANCYLTKPVGLDEFLALVRAIESFWLSLAKLPAA